MKVSEHFIIQEFVPKAVYQQFGEKSIWFIDERIISMAEWFREKFGPIQINTWHNSGPHDSRGFRPCSDAEGAKLSQHRFGRAVDLVFVETDHNYAQIRQIVLANFDELFDKFGLTTMEADTPSWLHLDLRWTGMDKLLIVPYR